jgi:hypothetical protein
MRRYTGVYKCKDSEDGGRLGLQFRDGPGGRGQRRAAAGSAGRTAPGPNA